MPVEYDKLYFFLKCFKTWFSARKFTFMNMELIH